LDLKPLTRELHSDERRKLLAHLLAFGTEDRRLRFGHALSDDGVCHYVEEIDLSRDAIFVANDADLAIIGAAHLARDDGHAPPTIFPPTKSLNEQMSAYGPSRPIAVRFGSLTGYSGS